MMFMLRALLAIAFCFQAHLTAASSGRFTHDIQLQLFDYNGVPVDNTKFWITLDVAKEGDRVTLYFPAINFQVGQCSTHNPDCPQPPMGYIYTSDGFLPQDLRPVDLAPISVNATSNNGLSEVYSMSGTPTPQTPPSGYIVQVTNAGAVQIQGPGAFGNLLSTGPQTVLPCSISYIAKKKKKICSNFVLSSGHTNVEHFTGLAKQDNIRDSHINDAYKNVVAWAWTDNHNVDKTQNTLNVFVVVGKVGSDGKLRLKKPVQLTDFPPGVYGWDTSVAINRKDKNNIVVTYAMTDTTNPNAEVLASCRAVSFDCGKTWGEINVPVAFTGTISGNQLTVTNVAHGVIEPGQTIYTYTATYPAPGIAPNTLIVSQISGTTGGVGVYTVSGNPQTTGPNYIFGTPQQNGQIPINTPYSYGVGDYPGVAADEFGNFWIGATNDLDANGYSANTPFLVQSQDFGNTWDFVYKLPDVPHPEHGDSYDYPHLAFGAGGVWIYSDYYDAIKDLYPVVSFVPNNGRGEYGPGATTYLNTLSNAMYAPTIAAANDGRLWAMGYPSWNTTNIPPVVTLFKSPGQINENYAGPWLNGFMNQSQYSDFHFSSVPVQGYFLSVQGLIYDEKREALYALFAAQYPDFSQNMQLYFSISRNNGQTWSRPYDISTTAFANRGFCSMALDRKNGQVYIGWYDGRSDKKQQNLQYYGAYIKADMLDRLVKKLPHSLPMYKIASQGASAPVN